MCLLIGRASTVTTDADIETDYWSVRPQFFKTLVGRSHREFSTMHQQDASEYFLHLMEVMDKAEASEGGRLGCSGKVGNCLDSMEVWVAVCTE